MELTYILRKTHCITLLEFLENLLAEDIISGAPSKINYISETTKSDERAQHCLKEATQDIPSAF